MKKVCFIVMGFGKKTDFENNRKVDLDIIYKSVIKNVFEKNFPEFKLIRADEVSTSKIIDVDMYDLLLRADLVIADITTLNPNAIYELGVRHALRPFSTIIIADELSKLPFDINRNRIMTYPETGEELSADEINEISKRLVGFISKTIDSTETDSPFYTYLPKVTPPDLSDKEYGQIIKKAEKKDESISVLMEKASDNMNNALFEQAFDNWNDLGEIIPENSYFTQQKALARYKSKIPTETEAFDDALTIIKELSPDTTLDIETLGLTGAIYKNLYSLNGDNVFYLEKAINYYKKGYIIQDDYYNGENYLNCLILKLKQPHIEIKEKEYILFEVEKESKNIISIIEKKLKDRNQDINPWMYSTLATCNLYAKNQEEFESYKERFISTCNVPWNVESFNTTINQSKHLLGIE